MIPVAEALRCIRALDPGERRIRRSSSGAIGLVLARPVEARRPAPAFDRSAMDGYAVRTTDLADASEESPVRLSVSGTVAAGASGRGEEPPRLEPETALRILTGAPLPEGATAVVRQEAVRVGEGWVEFCEAVGSGANIRRQGEEVGPGDPLLAAGEVVGPAGVALLLDQGIREVDVRPPPPVAVVVTGDELVPAAAEPGPGQIRDTLSPLLSSALDLLGFVPTLLRCPDDRSTLRERLGRALERHRLVLTCGGVSVGDRDYVRSTLADLGVEERFWGVAQKPGKPLCFGVRGDRCVLGLPGNPVSAAVCFWIYGVVLLRRLAGYPDSLLELPSCRTRVDDGALRTHRRPGRTVFARARTEEARDGVHRSALLSAQGSHMLSGLARADSLVRIPPAEKAEASCLAYRLPVPRPSIGGRRTG